MLVIQKSFHVCVCQELFVNSSVSYPEGGT